jgi:penicillin-binding protein activator
MKKLIISSSLVASALALLTGCGTDAHYVQTGGRESVVNVGVINIQDYMQAADAMIESLLASGALDHVSTPPALIAISRVENRTAQQLETDLLTKKIRIALNKSGKAITRINFGVGADGKPLMEDPSGKGIQDEANFRSDVKTERLPDFTLSGKIIQTRVASGNVHQSTYSFQLSLAKGSDAVWEDEKEITKQGTRSSVGF